MRARCPVDGAKCYSADCWDLGHRANCIQQKIGVQEPSELEVQVGAVILATTPLIDAPKLSHNEWMGLSRSILKAAAAVRKP